VLQHFNTELDSIALPFDTATHTVTKNMAALSQRQKLEVCLWRCLYVRIDNESVLSDVR
jgi:hypothetical protein